MKAQLTQWLFIEVVRLIRCCLYFSLSSWLFIREITKYIFNWSFLKKICKELIAKVQKGEQRIQLGNYYSNYVTETKKLIVEIKER